MDLCQDQRVRHLLNRRKRLRFIAAAQITRISLNVTNAYWERAIPCFSASIQTTHLQFFSKPSHLCRIQVALP